MARNLLDQKAFLLQFFNRLLARAHHRVRVPRGLVEDSVHFFVVTCDSRVVPATPVRLLASTHQRILLYVNLLRNVCRQKPGVLFRTVLEVEALIELAVIRSRLLVLELSAVVVARRQEGADRAAAHVDAHSCNRPASLLLLEKLLMPRLFLCPRIQLIVVALRISDLGRPRPVD